MNGRPHPRWLMVAGIVVAFAAGDQMAKVARRSAGSQERGDASGNGTTVRPAGIFDEGFRWDAADAGSLQGVKQRVMKRWEASPGGMVDFELRDETMRVMEKVPTGDLEAWMRELRSEEYADDDKDVPHQLRELSAIVLARREGGSFIRSVVANPPEEVYADEVMDHWIRHDPAAALDWLEGEVPEEIGERLDSYREDALEALSGKDRVEFERRLAMEDPEIREGLLDGYAARTGVAEGRGRLLARAAGSPHEEAMAIWKGLLEREGLEDPERAYATLKELDVSAEARAELDEGLVFNVLYRGFLSAREVDGASVMQAWVERNPGEPVPKRILRAFGTWSESDPEGAVVWVAEQPAGPRREALSKTLNEQGMEDHVAFADKVARIGDADIRARMQRRLKVSWLRRDANAAAEWEKGLPEEDRERLKEMEGE